MKKSSGISKKRKVASLSTRDKSEAVAGVETRCSVQMRRARKTRHKSGLTASSFRFRKRIHIFVCVCVCVLARARGHRYRIHWSDLHFNWILQDLTSSPPIQLDQPAWKETFVRSFELCNPRVPPPVSNNMAFPIIGVAPDDNQTRFALISKARPAILASPSAAIPSPPSRMD